MTGQSVSVSPSLSLVQPHPLTFRGLPFAESLATDRVTGMSFAFYAPPGSRAERSPRD